MSDFLYFCTHKAPMKSLHPNVRWDEIMRIAQSQVVVTAEMNTEDGGKVSVRQSTEAEEELAKIYSLLEISPNPIGKVKSQVHPKAPPKKIHLLKIRGIRSI